MKVVSDTTPIISLASIGKLSILEELFGEIIIPQSVYNEIKAQEGYGYKEVDSEFIKGIDKKKTPKKAKDNNNKGNGDED